METSTGQRQGVVARAGAAIARFSRSLPQVTIDLDGVANDQIITITLNNVSDGANSGNVSVSMGVLMGDVTGNRVVSNPDVGSVKSQVAALVTSSNFRDDVTANGVISNTDVSTTKVQVGTQLP
jgi:hypothetical protein